MAEQELKDGFELSSTNRTLPIALLRAREAVMDRFRPMLQKHSVTEQQWRVLRVLQEAGEIDASELANRACILAPSLTRIMKTLEAQGFIEANKDPNDGRRMRIRLTTLGDQFIRGIAPESAAIYAEIEAKIGREHIASLLDDIDALLRALAEDD